MWLDLCHFAVTTVVGRLRRKMLSCWLRRRRVDWVESSIYIYYDKKSSTTVYAWFKVLSSGTQSNLRSSKDYFDTNQSTCITEFTLCIYIFYYNHRTKSKNKNNDHPQSYSIASLGVSNSPILTTGDNCPP